MSRNMSDLGLGESYEENLKEEEPRRRELGKEVNDCFLPRPRAKQRKFFVVSHTYVCIFMKLILIEINDTNL